MFFPIRTDRRLKRTPWVNYSLIGVNAFVFIVLQRAGQATDPLWLLQPADPSLFQYVTYQFMHAGWMHLIGNMVFLWVFGNAVEDRLGRAGYLMFYLAGGIFAALGHMTTAVNPVLGASGAVAAVTGAYLALFPLTNITVVYFFIIIGALELPGVVVILIRIGQDALFQIIGVGNTAYMAHLAGYIFGFAIGMGLLLSRLLEREPYDLLALIEQKRRRQQFRGLSRRGANPWTSAGPSDPGGLEAKPPTAEEQALMDQRTRVSYALRAGDMGEASAAYRDLLAHHADQVMSQQQQLDLANQLMSEGRYDHAATAYKLFLRHFPQYPNIQQVRLILGLIYARYLDQPGQAREQLAQAEGNLDEEERALAQQVMAELK